MKHTNKLALLLSLGALLPIAASAKTLEQSYIESCRTGTDIPVPIEVVSPKVGGYDIGQAVVLQFVVDTTGHTSDISIKSATATSSATDRGFAEAAVDAVKQWRFTPAQVHGTAVATKVVLPIRVVETAKSANLLALN
jgi:TonB family protein